MGQTGRVQPSADALRPTWPSSPVRRTSRVALLLTFAGMAVTLVGTFLPWLDSGRVGKNSYQLIGGVDRYLPDLTGVPHLVLSAWPWLGPAWAMTAALYVLGPRRCAACLGLLPALLAGISAGTVLSSGERWLTPAIETFVSLRDVGPAVTLTGAIMAASGCIWVFFRSRTEPIGR